MHMVFVVVLVLIVATFAHPHYDESAEANHIEQHARFYGAEQGFQHKCIYWEAAYGHPDRSRQHKQNVMTDGSISGDWKILGPDNEVKQTVKYTSKKHASSAANLDNMKIMFRNLQSANRCPYWENFYGDSETIRSHHRYTTSDGTLKGEFKILIPDQETLQIINYTAE